MRTAIVESLGPAIHQDPAMAMGMIGTAQRAVQFLADKLPTPLHDVHSYTPLSSTPTPSKGELATFARYFQAVDKPLTVLRDLSTGTVTREQIEALKAVYPELYGSIRSQAFERLRDMDRTGKRVPVREQILLDSLLELNGAANGALSPQFGAQFGPAIGTTQQQQQPKQSSRRLQLGDRLATGTNGMIGGMK